jgi:hypothetical protein
MRWAEYVAHMRDMRNTYNILVGKPERKRQFGRSRRKWDDNIRMDLREIRCEHVDWIHLAQDRDQWRAALNTVMNLPVPKKAVNLLTS